MKTKILIILTTLLTSFVFAQDFEQLVDQPATQTQTWTWSSLFSKILWPSNFDFGMIVWLALKLVWAVLIFLIWYFISKIVAWKVANKVREHIIWEDAYMLKVADLVWTLVSNFLTLLFFLIALTVIWIDFSMFLWGLSIWIWFWLKQVLENFVAWILVLTTKEFRLGDIVEVQWRYNIIWKIEELNIRYIVLRTFDLRRVVLPNTEMISNPIKTFTSEETIRLENEFAVSNLENLVKVETLTLEALKNVPFVKNPEQAIFSITGFDEYWTNIKVMYNTIPNFDAAIWIVQSKVWLAIKQHLEWNNVNLSYPHIAITAEENDKWFLKNMMVLKKVMETPNS